MVYYLRLQCHRWLSRLKPNLAPSVAKGAKGILSTFLNRTSGAPPDDTIKETTDLLKLVLCLGCGFVSTSRRRSHGSRGTSKTSVSCHDWKGEIACTSIMSSTLYKQLCPPGLCREVSLTRLQARGGMPHKRTAKERDRKGELVGGVKSFSRQR